MCNRLEPATSHDVALLLLKYGMAAGDHCRFNVLCAVLCYAVLHPASGARQGGGCVAHVHHIIS